MTSWSVRAAVPEVWSRAQRLFAQIAPDLDADPYWDAYKLLPRVTRFHRALVRPMSKDEWLLAATDELHGFSERNRYLLDRLERPGLTATAASAAGHGTATLRVDADATYRLRSATVTAPCAGGFSLYADDDRNGLLDPHHDTLVARGALGTSAPATGRIDLAAGVRLAARDDQQPKHGTISAEIGPRLYRYFVTAERCAREASRWISTTSRRAARDASSSTSRTRKPSLWSSRRRRLRTGAAFRRRRCLGPSLGASTDVEAE